MNHNSSHSPTIYPSHNWLRTLHLAYVAGCEDAVLDQFIEELLSCFKLHGHQIVETPNAETDVLLTTA
ncbi:MAG: hypothetical protein ACPL4H_01860, partial [Anaerolineales bacterium]